MAVKIKSVIKNSYAEKSGISSGDTLISINDNKVIDVLDYMFYQTNTDIRIYIEKNSGETKTIRIRKGEYEEIGLEFETYLMDNQKTCRNKCIFCFIDQLPKGMRETLYFKDDDSRLSFLFGNYITLTNISEHEIQRIINMHISPINVSVHTTNPELRNKMMNNHFAGDSLKVLEKFAEASIKINCQIVSCPGINDSNELIRTLNDLKKLIPSIESISVVPVGLTKYRDNLHPLIPYDKERSSNVIDIIERISNEWLNEFGTRVVFAADEFYIKAKRPFPDIGFYEDFKQLENGVGAVSLLNNEFYAALAMRKKRTIDRYITIACGEAIAENISELLNSACLKFKGLSGKVIGIKNNFFGNQIDVSGLVTGRDLINQVDCLESIGDALLIPSVMLRHEGDMFLDNITLDDVKRSLNVDVIPLPNDGEKLLNAMIGKGED